ncbi:MAG: DUF6323 family protein [Huintestinicola sp.]
MGEYNNDFSLSALGVMLKADRIADAALSCNEYSEAYGLVLSEKQAVSLANTQNDALKSSGRIEFGEGIINKLIAAFCGSPYISQQNYEDTLHELISLFYAFKNDTWEAVSDDELIGFMKDSFDGFCHGDLSLLSEVALRGLSRHIHNGGTFESCQIPKETSYE